MMDAIEILARYEAGEFDSVRGGRLRDTMREILQSVPGQSATTMRQSGLMRWRVTALVLQRRLGVRPDHINRSGAYPPESAPK